MLIGSLITLEMYILMYMTVLHSEVPIIIMPKLMPKLIL